jgi:hypothetical protein
MQSCGRGGGREGVREAVIFVLFWCFVMVIIFVWNTKVASLAWLLLYICLEQAHNSIQHVQGLDATADSLSSFPNYQHHTPAGDSQRYV